MYLFTYRAYDNEGNSIEVPAPYFGPYKSGEPGHRIPPYKGPDPSTIKKIAEGVITVIITAVGIAGKLQEGDETGYPDPI
jgi:hypothetical protein